MTNFAACLAFTLRYEGGKVDDPRDPGGRTNAGVTQRTYQAYLARHGRTAVIEDVYQMTSAQRDDIYRSEFWAPIKGDLLAAGVDLAVFDFGVNSGPARAIKANAAARNADAADRVKAICRARLSFLHALRTFQTFGKGWTARVAACEALGIRMAENVRVGAAADGAPTSGSAARLQHEASAATTKATKHKSVALASPSASAAAVAASHGPHVPWWPLVLIATAGLVAAAYFAWRAGIHTQRASAMTAAAKGA